jgi:hypothetical protein
MIDRAGGTRTEVVEDCAKELIFLELLGASRARRDMRVDGEIALLGNAGIAVITQFLRGGVRGFLPKHPGECAKAVA